MTETLHVSEALDILYYDLPKAFVNLMPITDVSQLFRLERIPMFCHMIRKWLCPCLFSPVQPGRWDEPLTLEWLDLYAEEMDK